ncbi:MAG: hypothetical protein LUE12_01845 [Ruminococcus sp.]|nr:hypothetical protein [Ruminococcus sp.]
MYNGGGNLFAVVPENVDKDIVKKIENEAKKCLVTANIAFALSESISLSDFLGNNYNDVIREFEAELNAYKLSKLVFEAAPESQLLRDRLFEYSNDADYKDVKVNAEKLKEKNDYCEKCKKRIALYSKDKIKLCAGCLHKTIAGIEQKSVYHKKYMDRTGEKLSLPKDFSDIDRDHIAVIYADGNNMGGIVQGFRKISDMISFSDFVKKQMPQLVYDSLKKVRAKNFEIVAVGGDDIFIIVPAKVSIKLAVDLINEYKRVFGSNYPDTNSTLSVGICIAKTNTPVKVMLEAAEEELAAAKELVKKKADSKGSLSFRVFNTYEGSISQRGNNTLLPYTVEAAEKIIDFAANMKRDKTDVNTMLQNLSEAFKNCESSEEANLFFEYFNAKISDDKRIKLEKNIDSFSLDGAFYNSEYTEKNNLYLWDDLIDILEFGGGEYEN